MQLGINLLFTVLQGIVFLLVLIGTPIEMFRTNVSGITNICYTLWGSRACSKASYISHNFRCSREKSTMEAGGVCAIISIFLSLILLGLFLIKLKRRWMGIMSQVLGIICILTILIAWATAAAVYHQRMCSVLGMKLISYKNLGYNIGAGFGLLLTAWCLQVVVVVLLFVL